jgi:hypothetical protein
MQTRSFETTGSQEALRPATNPVNADGDENGQRAIKPWAEMVYVWTTMVS